VIPPGMPPPPPEPTNEKEKPTKNEDTSTQKRFSKKKLSFLIPRRLTSTPFGWKIGGSVNNETDKPALPATQSEPQLGYSQHNFMRTKSEQTMQSSGDTIVQRKSVTRQSVSMHLRMLISEEKKKLQQQSNTKTDDGTTDGTKAQSATINTLPEAKRSLSPTDGRRELTVHAPKMESATMREPMKKEVSLPTTITAEPLVISVSEEPPVSPILTRSVSMSKVKPPTEEDEISKMFDSIFDWYDTKTTRKPKEGETKRENADDMDDETFDNILATLKNLEQLDAK